MSNNNIAKTRAEYDAMAEDWELVDDLWGGTKAMRAAGELWLPKEEMESTKGWEARRGRSVLFNGYKQTVKTLVGKPFTKAIAIGEDMGARMVEAIENIDLNGAHLDVFARALFETDIHYGLVHILVDYPKTKGELTLAEEREQGVRPYFCQVSPKDVIGWKSERRGGRDVLSQLRIRQTVTRPDPEDEFGEVEVEQVVVWEPGSFRLFEQTTTNKKTEWKMIDEGETKNMDRIPLVTVYTRATGPLQAAPSLMDLAYLNVQHWQSSSDQSNILHIARVPILLMCGFDKKDKTTIGASRAMFSSNERANAKFVEHGGKAIGAGREHAQDIENHMRVSGLTLLIDREVEVTATGERMDANERESELGAYVRGLEDGLEEAFGLAAQWIGKPDEAGSLSIHRDFAISMRSAQEAQTLIQAREKREITQMTLLRELQKRGIIGDEVNLEDEVDATELEAEKALAGMPDGFGAGASGDGDGDEEEVA